MRMSKQEMFIDGSLIERSYVKLCLHSILHSMEIIHILSKMREIMGRGLSLLGFAFGLGSQSLFLTKIALEIFYANLSLISTSGSNTKVEKYLPTHN